MYININCEIVYKKENYNVTLFAFEFKPFSIEIFRYNFPYKQDRALFMIHVCEEVYFCSLFFITFRIKRRKWWDLYH
jgi:hypothetical protein